MNLYELCKPGLWYQLCGQRSPNSSFWMQVWESELPRLTDMSNVLHGHLLNESVWDSRTGIRKMQGGAKYGYMGPPPSDLTWIQVLHQKHTTRVPCRPKTRIVREIPEMPSDCNIGSNQVRRLRKHNNKRLASLFKSSCKWAERHRIILTGIPAEAPRRKAGEITIEQHQWLLRLIWLISA